MSELSFEQAAALIQTDYVDRVFGFLNGKYQQVTTSKNFVKIHEVVMNQCDTQDNGGKLYQYFQQIIKDYIEKEALIYIRQQADRGLLMQAFVKIFDDFAMLAKLMDRMFDYLNRYYLKNYALKMLGVTAMELFVNKCY